MTYLPISEATLSLYLGDDHQATQVNLQEFVHIFTDCLSWTPGTALLFRPNPATTQRNHFNFNYSYLAQCLIYNGNVKSQLN